MKKRNLFLTSTLAATLLLAACNTAEEETTEQPVEEERAIEETIEQTEPVRDEETTETTETADVTEPSETEVNDPAAEQTPVEKQEGVVTESVEPEEADETTETSATEEQQTAAAAPQTAVDVSKKKANEVVLYKSDANAEKVVPAQKVNYTYKTNGPITKYIVDQLGYGQYYKKHSVSADERVIMIDFNESILSSQVIQGSAGGLMFENSIVASIFANIPKAQVVKLRVNGKEEVLDHVSFAGEITRAAFEANQ